MEKIALNLSALWQGRALKIAGYDDPDSSYDRDLLQKHINASKEWFSRAGPSTLLDYSCRIDLLDETSSTAPEIVSQVLFPYSHRCRKLDLDVYDVTDMMELLKLSSDHIPALENVIVRFDFSEGESEINIFRHAVRLRQVSLAAFTLSINHGPTTDHVAVFPWKQLTHLTIAMIPVLMWAHILRECRGLQEGIFVIKGMKRINNTQILPPPTFPTMMLQQLVLLTTHYPDPPYYTYANRFNTWLNNLEFPRLSRLSCFIEAGTESSISHQSVTSHHCVSCLFRTTRYLQRNFFHFAAAPWVWSSLI